MKPLGNPMALDSQQLDTTLALDSVAPAQPAAPVPAPAPRKWRKRLLLGGALLAVLGGLGTLGHGWWTEGRFMVKTDDAYVQADIGGISAKISGYVAEVAVTENQPVQAGDVLLRLDDGDYRIALALAKTRLVTQDATLARIQTQKQAAEAAVGQANAAKAAAEAVLHNADLTNSRTAALVARKSAAQSQLDDAEAALETARASLAGAVAQIASAEANVAVLQAEYDEAASQKQALSLAVDQAQRDLDLTVLRAPFDGVASNLSFEPGDLVSAGQRLGAVVPVQDLFIEANYKESQLEGIAPGARVKIEVDALKGQSFEGRVESIAPATGALFSVLPPSNATGNFTKVVQRVPVRISIPAEALASGALRAGLSVVVEVDSRTPAQTAVN